MEKNRFYFPNDEHLNFLRKRRLYTTALEIMRRDSRHSHRFSHFITTNNRYTYLLFNYVLIFSCIAASTLQQLYVDRYLSRNFRPLRPYKSIVIPSQLIKRQDIYSTFHALKLQLHTCAMKSIHYSINGSSLKFYHFFP